MLLAATRGDAPEIEELRHEEIKLLTRNIEFAPRDPQLRSLLAVLHTYVGEFDKAEDRMREAVELAPARIDLLMGLAEVQRVRYQQSPDEATYQRALETLQKLGELAPHEPAVAQMLEQLRAARERATPRRP
jgi:Flp pilus assembly protein TadD